jgi:hypothetical protein
MSERKFSYEISGETLTKIFLNIEESLSNKTVFPSINIKDTLTKDRIKLTRVNLNMKNPFLSKIKKIRKESFQSNKTS